MKRQLLSLLLLAAFFLSACGVLSVTPTVQSTQMDFPKIDRHPEPADYDRGAMTSLPTYDPSSNEPGGQMDLRSYDLSDLDLSQSLEDLLYATFDDRTVWPPDDRMPQGFDWERILELGKEPGLGVREPLRDPGDPNSYEPGTWWAESFYAGDRFSDRLLVPMQAWTTASPLGEDEYVFYRRGGPSWSIPYLSGVYALAAQVDPSITPEHFWSLAMETGYTIELDHEGEAVPFGPIIDPVALMDAL